MSRAQAAIASDITAVTRVVGTRSHRIERREVFSSELHALPRGQLEVGFLPCAEGGGVEACVRRLRDLEENSEE